MSAGPIKAQRDAWKPPTVSTSNADRVCAVIEARVYCGRKNKQTSALWDKVTCADCHAAHRADLAAARRNGR